VECTLDPMTDSDTGRATRESIPSLVSAALLASDLPASTTAERAASCRYVDLSVAAMPDVTRAGVRAAAAAVYTALTVMGGRRFRRQSPERRAELATRLAAVQLPILSEFTRLTRGLGLVGVYEARFSHTGNRYVERDVPGVTTGQENSGR
jgi:hypothetical protein